MFSSVANSSVIHLVQNVKYIAITLKVKIVVHRLHGRFLKWSFIYLDLFSKTISVNIVYLNPFVPNVPFLYPPENIRKPYGFLKTSGGRERVYWERMG